MGGINRFPESISVQIDACGAAILGVPRVWPDQMLHGDAIYV